MPYIDQKNRPELDCVVRSVIHVLQQHHYHPGELNYVLTTILLGAKATGYQGMNRLVGVLECVKLEFYRRALAIYEDKKIQENGDVYGD